MIFYTSAIILLTASLSFINAPSFNTWDADKVFEPGTSIPAKEELNKCVDTASELLLANIDLKTDTSLLNDILENDMHLGDMPDVGELLGKDLDHQQSLLPLLDQVRKGVTETHPALGVTLCVALGDKTTASIFSSPDADLIKRTIHHMFLLNKIVEKLANDNTFMENVQKHLQDKVNSMTPHKSMIGHVYDLFKAGGLFGVAKAYTIDGAIKDYKTFRERGSITPDEISGRIHGLSLNILEATTADLFHGFKSNAKVGKTLTWMHPSTIQVVGENRIIQYVTDMDYARLYETWNFAFITGNLDFPNLLYPKLLIPRVLLAEASDYLYNRVLALWLSISFYLMADLKGKEHITFTGRRELAQLWGKINLRYTKYLHGNDE